MKRLCSPRIALSFPAILLAMCPGLCAAQASLPQWPPAAQPQAVTEKTDLVAIPDQPVREFIQGTSDRPSVKAVSRQATLLINEGVTLAGKGASFSAQAKFVSALALIADALDAEQQTMSHTRALAAGLTALREAEDFAQSTTPTGGVISPMTAASRHLTPVLKASGNTNVSRLHALQLYYTYATSQLMTAAGEVPEASAALSYLGRLQLYLHDGVDRNAALAEPRALAYHQAAVLVDRKNYRAANELGVVLARRGQLDSAKSALLYSAGVEPRPESLKNLSMVYHKLGDKLSAESALARANTMSQRVQQASFSQASTGDSPIYWVDHPTFETASSAEEFGGEPQKVPASSDNVPKEVARDSAPREEGAMAKTLNLLKGSSESSSTAATPPAARSVRPAAESHVKSAVHAGDKRSPVTPASTCPHHGQPCPRDFLQPLPWEVFAQGEYIGPARLPHVPEYYLRVDDVLNFVFRLNGVPTNKPYTLNVGDIIRIGSMTIAAISVETPVQPDGSIMLPQIGKIVAAGRSMEDLRAELEERFRKFYTEPTITITPVLLNKTVEEFRQAISSQSGAFTNQSFQAKVSPNGMVQLPAIGSVSAQGLTLAELQREVELRYSPILQGVECTPVLSERAPRYIYVLGEVKTPGRFTLEAPTTVIQAIALAGSWNIGGNLRDVIVLRRDDNWRLMATRVDVKPALFNHKSLCSEDIWLRDSDIVIVSKLPIQVVDDIIELVFTRGIYAVAPFGISLSYFKDLSSIGQL